MRCVACTLQRRRRNVVPVVRQRDAQLTEYTGERERLISVVLETGELPTEVVCADSGLASSRTQIRSLPTIGRCMVKSNSPRTDGQADGGTL